MGSVVLGAEKERMMKTNLFLEMDLEIKFAFHKSVPRTRDYPGDTADTEILEIKILGKAISEDLFDAIIKEYSDEIDEWCLDHAMYEMQEEEMAYAEHMRDLREDR